MADREEIAKWFQKYRMRNNELITYFKSIESKLRQIQKIESVSSKDFAGGGFFGSSDKNKRVKELNDLLTKETVNELLPKVQQMIELIEKENNELQNYFKSLKMENIHSLKQFEQICLSHNEQKYVLAKEIYHHLRPATALGSEIRGITTELKVEYEGYFTESAQVFIRYFFEFYIKVMSESKKDDVFIAFATAMNYLAEYVRQSDSHIQDFAEGFMLAIKKNINSVVNNDYKTDYENMVGTGKWKDNFKNSLEVFLNKYFYSGASLGKAIQTELNGFLTELEWQNGYPNKNYDEINNDGNKLDKFLKERLTQLLDSPKLKSSGGKNEILDKVKKITKVPTNMKDLEDKWKKGVNLSRVLQTGITNAGYRFVEGMTFTDIIFPLKSKIDGKTEITLEEFEKLFKEDNDVNRENVEYIINYVSNITINQGEKYWENEAFEDYLNFLKTRVIIVSTEGSGSSRNKRGSDWFKDANETNDLRSVIEGVKTQISTLVSSAEDKFSEVWNNSKGEIMDSIKVIAKYIDDNGGSFSEKNNLLSRLKSVYENLDNANSSSEVKQYCYILININSEGNETGLLKDILNNFNS